MYAHYIRTTRISAVLLAVAAVAVVWAGQARANRHHHRHRSPREAREKNGDSPGLDLSTSDIRTTGQKWSSDEYHTLSSLTSNVVAATSDDSAKNVGKDDTYPALTTDLPSPVFIPRNGYIRNPYLYGSGGGGDRDYYVDGNGMQHFDYSTINGNTMSKWNRYYPGRKQLKKYGPVIMETDVSVDSGVGSVSGYNGHDTGVDYSNTVANYESETDNYKPSSHDVDGVVGWYSEPPVPHSSRPVLVGAEVRHPGHKMTIDINKLGLLALFKIGLVKLKVLLILKLLVFLAIKLKLFAFAKLKMFMKSYLFFKLLKLFVFPFLPGLYPLLKIFLNPTMSSPMTPTMMPMMAMMNDVSSNSVRYQTNDTFVESVHRSNVNTDGATTNLFQFATAVYSAKCPERMACHAAIARPPSSFQSIWTNWLLSALVNYTPNNNLKLYMSTFKDVSDFRFQNIVNYPSTEEMIKWCDQRYSCEEETANDNII